MMLLTCTTPCSDVACARRPHSLGQGALYMAAAVCLEKLLNVRVVMHCYFTCLPCSHRYDHTVMSTCTCMRTILPMMQRALPNCHPRGTAVLIEEVFLVLSGNLAFNLNISLYITGSWCWYKKMHHMTSSVGSGLISVAWFEAMT